MPVFPYMCHIAAPVPYLTHYLQVFRYSLPLSHVILVVLAFRICRFSFCAAPQSPSGLGLPVLATSPHSITACYAMLLSRTQEVNLFRLSYVLGQRPWDIHLSMFATATPDPYQTSRLIVLRNSLYLPHDTFPKSNLWRLWYLLSRLYVYLDWSAAALYRCRASLCFRFP